MQSWFFLFIPEVCAFDVCMHIFLCACVYVVGKGADNDKHECNFKAIDSQPCICSVCLYLSLSEHNLTLRMTLTISSDKTFI